MLISYRKNLDRIIFLSMMSFFVLPVLATIYQALAYSFSLQCLAIVISTQIMFVMDTVEMNMRFHSQQAAYEKARYEAERFNKGTFTVYNYDRSQPAPANIRA
uniref:hypothetical protein n=1 Tax=Bifidobacterium pseudocatenulatum TaxID=28026 RepID=UPI003FEF65F8